MNADSRPLIEIGKKRGVAELVLNRSSARNSLSTALVDALSRALELLAADSDVRVLVVSARGPVFSAGMDLKEARESSPAQVRVMAERMVATTMKLRTFGRPVIAKVRGMAYAAGLELVLACDLAYAASTARFATPGVNVGVWCMTPMVPLLRIVPPRHAAEMLMLGRPIDANHAERIGLINRSLDESELDAHVEGIASELAAKSPFTLELGKKAMNEQRDVALPEAYARALWHLERNARHRDAMEGMDAFIGKRSPKWSDPVRPQAMDTGDPEMHRNGGER